MVTLTISCYIHDSSTINSAKDAVALPREARHDSNPWEELLAWGLHHIPSVKPCPEDRRGRT